MSEPSTCKQKDYDRNSQKERAECIIWALSITLLIVIVVFTLTLKDGHAILGWVLASIGGTIVYLLMQAATRYRKIDTVPECLLPVTDAVVDNGQKAKKKHKKAAEEQNKAMEEKCKTMEEQIKAIKKEQDEADFIGWTPWYVMNVFRGPIFALLVMIALTNSSLQVGLLEPTNSTPTPESTDSTSYSTTATPTINNVNMKVDASAVMTMDTPSPSPTPTPDQQYLSAEVDLKNAPADFLLVIAFLLGLQSRLPVSILETLGERVFGKIWEKMQESDEDNLTDE